MSNWQSNSAMENLNQNYGCVSPPSNSQSNRSDCQQREPNGYGHRVASGEQNYNYEQTMAIRRECIDMIIGKDGSNIKRLQSYYNVRMILDRRNSTVTVMSNREIDIIKALLYIREEINKPEGAFQDSIIHFNMNGDDDQLSSMEIIKRNEELSKEYWAKCQPFTKNFYFEFYQVESLTEEEVINIRLANNNTNVSRISKQCGVGSDNIPNPVWKFEHCFAAYPDLMIEILRQGFKKPLPIQAQGWPVLLKGEDILALSQTGTGKTLLYVLPSFIHRKHTPVPCSRKPCANILIVVPSKEIGLQIECEVNKYQILGVKAVCIYVGSHHRKHLHSIVNAADIIICTPDHLSYLHKKKKIDISKISFLVLDEVDRMLHLGFESEMRRILHNIRPDRQTVMTSATWSEEVKCFAEKFMDNFLQVSVGSLDSVAPQTVRQIFEFVKGDMKYHKVTNLLNKMKPNEKVLIFCESASRAITLYSKLFAQYNICSDYLCDSRDKIFQEKIIERFKSGETKILIGSDYAARCLDVEDITHVINYDFPFAIEEYVYRVGRTGRAGREGIVINYLTSFDCEIAPELIKYLKKSNQAVPYELYDLANFFEMEKERTRLKNSNRSQRSGFGSGHRNRY